MIALFLIFWGNSILFSIHKDYTNLHSHQQSDIYHWWQRANSLGVSFNHWRVSPSPPSCEVGGTPPLQWGSWGAVRFGNFPALQIPSWRNTVLRESSHLGVNTPRTQHRIWGTSDARWGREGGREGARHVTALSPVNRSWHSEIIFVSPLILIALMGGSRLHLIARCC